MKKLTITGMIYAVAWALLLAPSFVNAQQAKDIILTPTFESIGIELPANVNEKSLCKVRFRPTGGEWRDGLSLFVDRYTDSEDRDKGFRGSIVLLEPNKEYEVELCYSINGGTCTSISKKVTTWKEEFTGTRISVSNRADLMRKLKSGSSGNYMIFDGENKAVIDAGTKDESAISLENLRYVVLRNMKITGGKRSAVSIRNAQHIVVENCDIYKWGDNKTYCGSDYNGFTENGKVGGVYVKESSQVVVQRNKIHDPIANSCNWSSVPQALQDRKNNPISSHPAGPRGIALVRGVTESVFRYNHVYAKFEDRKNHYFSDIFNAEEGGAASNIDVYGNDFGNAWDDGIEIEGLNRNIRVWNNAIHDVYQGVASDRNDLVYYGPVYIWRNVITNLAKDPNDKDGRYAGFKLDNQRGKGGIYLFNNTVSGLGGQYTKPSSTISNGPQYNLTAWNNIFEVNSSRSYKDDTKNSKGELNGLITGQLNYNAFSHGSNEYMTRKGWEKNSLFNVNFNYKKDGLWNYYVQGNAQKAGTPINNFADLPTGKVGLGASQEGVWKICVGPEASRNCSKGTNNPPTEPEAAPIVASKATITTKTASSLDASYWAGVSGYDFTDPADKSDNKVTFKAVWDEQYLVIGVLVRDNDPLALIGEETKLWKNDAVDLLFDPRNTGSSNWDTLLGHRQVIVDVAERQYREPTGFSVQAQRTPLVLNNSKASLYEVRIPWAKLGNITPRPDLAVGFDLANHDLDPEGTATQKSQFTYTGRVSAFKVPSEFAKLVLSGAKDAFPAANQWYFLENREYAKRLDTDNCNADGPVDVSSGTDTDKQWRFVSVGEGYYALENRCSERWLTTSGEQISLQAGSSAAKKTHWKLIAVDAANASEAGWYHLRNREEGNHLDADPSGAVDANNPGDNPDKQWKLIAVEDNARTGLEEKSPVAVLEATRQLVIYPNPASEGNARLQLSGFGEQAQVQVMDMKGNVVYQGTHNEPQVELTQRFSRGLYIVRISDAQGTLTQKLLVE